MAPIVPQVRSAQRSLSVETCLVVATIVMVAAVALAYVAYELFFSNEPKPPSPEPSVKSDVATATEDFDGTKMTYTRLKDPKTSIPVQEHADAEVVETDDAYEDLSSTDEMTHWYSDFSQPALCDQNMSQLEYYIKADRDQSLRTGEALFGEGKPNPIAFETQTGNIIVGALPYLGEARSADDIKTFHAQVDDNKEKYLNDLYDTILISMYLAKARSFSKKCAFHLRKDDAASFGNDPILVATLYRLAARHIGIDTVYMHGFSEEERILSNALYLNKSSYHSSGAIDRQTFLEEVNIFLKLSYDTENGHFKASIDTNAVTAALSKPVIDDLD